MAPQANSFQKNKVMFFPRCALWLLSNIVETKAEYQEGAEYRMITTLNQGITLINNMTEFARKIINKDKSAINKYIDEVYQNIKVISDDYYKILFELETYIMENSMTLDGIIVYLERSRIPFKTLRAYVESFIEKGYYKKDENLEAFTRGVLGVLQGGLEHDKVSPCKYNSDSFNNHTILDMIWKCELLKEKEDTEELKETLLGYIRKQLQELDNAWKLVCDSYIDLKKRYKL